MATAHLDRRGVLVACPSCGKTNRLAYQTLGRATRCGHCQAPLALPGTPLDVPDADVFGALVTAASLPVVVDFWAPWCGPCRMMAPEVDTVAHQMAGTWLVTKVNTEAVPGIGEQFRIRSIPTMAVFRDGREAARDAGARPAAAITTFVIDSLGAG